MGNLSSARFRRGRARPFGREHLVDPDIHRVGFVHDDARFSVVLRRTSSFSERRIRVDALLRYMLHGFHTVVGLYL